MTSVGAYVIGVYFVRFIRVKVADSGLLCDELQG